MILRIIRRVLLAVMFVAAWCEDRLAKLNRKSS